ncbi:MAG: hypothetical protein II272_03175 [Oscillospiraceae bacterium]|jgi:hypothetical protein|nr:hypothetical protein [Oscillospiraceae bacterium]
MTIRLASVSDVREFVSLATAQPYSVLVEDGDRTVNATSFMEMFTLDFSVPLHLNIEEAHKEHFRSAAEKFLITA